MFRHRTFSASQTLTLVVSDLLQSSQTTSGQTISWALWPWASAERNWKTPKTWKTSTSTDSSSGRARYACVCLCVYMLITGVSSQSLLITQLLSVSPGLPVTRALIITFPLSPHPSAHPSSALCQWKIPPAQSKHIKAKPNTGCSHSQLLLLFDGSDTHDVVNDGLMIVEN